MMEDTLKKFKEQHLENYKSAILETIKNNTNVLVDEDIMSLVKKPPLDSMDVIKSKFLDVAKKNKVVLDTESLDKMMDRYRKSLLKVCDEVRNVRLDVLNDVVNSHVFEKETDIIKIRKKDLEVANKKIKKILKEHLKDMVDKEVIKKINNVFNNVNEEAKLKKINDDIVKVLNGSYQRQLLENADIKILVKDTTLINGVKEQSERYLFTLENSRLYNSELEK
jgi:hypothetical protein